MYKPSNEFSYNVRYIEGIIFQFFKWPFGLTPWMFLGRHLPVLFSFIIALSFTAFTYMNADHLRELFNGMFTHSCALSCPNCARGAGREYEGNLSPDAQTGFTLCRKRTREDPNEMGSDGKRRQKKQVRGRKQGRKSGSRSPKRRKNGSGRRKRRGDEDEYLAMSA